MPSNTGIAREFKGRYPDSTAPDATVAVNFLCLAANHAPITVVTIPATGSDRDARVMTFDPDADVERMRSFIAFNETQPCQVFYLANVANGGGFPKRAGITAIRNITLDFDPKKGEPLEDERIRLRALADKFIHGPVQPRAIVDTGGGMQVLFQLLDPIEITNGTRDQVVADMDALMKSLARSFGADTATCRIESLFRAPGTFNWPTPAKARDGRERSVAGIWFQGGPRTSLDDLRALCLVPAEEAAVRPPAVDLGDVDEHMVIEALGAPDKLPARIKERLNDNPPLARAVLLPDVNSEDRSADDNALCMTCLRFRMPPGDIALVLSAYGAKVHETFEQGRLFSYVVGTVEAAIAKDPTLLHSFDPEQERVAEAQARAQVDRLKPLSFTEATERLRGAGSATVIKGLMRRREMTVVYGRSGSAKTFVSLDLAWRISLGLAWAEREVLQGAVVYVAAESPRSVITRMQALHAHHGASGGFYVIPAVVNMFDPKADLRPLVDAIDKAGIKPTTIWFDTLARSMIGGNENSTQDMSQLVSNGDRLRDRFDANIVWIHHTGKDESLGARGSSALRAATDTEIEISNSTTFRVTKLRDDEPFDQEFKLRQVPVALPDGEEVTTCVVEWYKGFGLGARTPADANREKVLRVLRMLGAPSTIREIMGRAEAEGMKPFMTSKALQAILARKRETEQFFKIFPPLPNEKKDTIRYGLYDW